MRTNLHRNTRPVLETLESRTHCSVTTPDGYEDGKEVGPVTFFDNCQHVGEGVQPSHEANAHALDGLTQAGLVQEGIPK